MAPELNGAELIRAERQRQIDAEGWTPEHDDVHSRGELARAACSYAMHASYDRDPAEVPSFWPWEREWWKPKDDQIRNLVRAGALIAAEIDRRQRGRK